MDDTGALLLGCLYLNSPLNLAGFQNRAGGIFFTLVFLGLAGGVSRTSTRPMLNSNEPSLRTSMSNHPEGESRSDLDSSACSQ